MSKTFAVMAGLLCLSVCPLHAEGPGSTRFKSPAGRYEVFFEPVNERTARLYNPSKDERPGQKPQFIVYFYVTGSSESLSSDWYTDVTPPKSPAEIFPTLLWSPQEEFVVLTHGQNAKEPDLRRWMVSLLKPSESGFIGDHLQWIDRYRLISDVRTKEAPGGIQMVDAKREKGELLVSPIPGIGYSIAAIKDHQVTVKQFLNHWEDDKDKTSWESFQPACFDLNLDTFKKRSVPCPVAP